VDFGPSAFDWFLTFNLRFGAYGLLFSGFVTDGAEARADCRVYLHYGDLSVSGYLRGLLGSIRPDEIYHLGAQSHVRVSFDMPEYTAGVTAFGTLRLLEALRKTDIKARFYQASSSEMFSAAMPPQNEQAPLKPQSRLSDPPCRGEIR
jgi:GDP-mannose 4,6-dehydratase